MAFKRVTAKVDLDAITHNYQQIKAGLGKQTKIMGIIKADAYGHGALPVARELEHMQVDMFGVATIQEAISLRKNGIKTPILILGFTDQADYQDLVQFDLGQTVYEPDMAMALHQVAAGLGKKAKIHLKVDTGMGRLGFPVDRTGIDQIKDLAKLSFIDIDGIFTHFAKADEADQTYTKRQLGLFQDFLNDLQAGGLQIPNIHAANSAAILNHPLAGFNMVRAGIILYGSYPSEDSKKEGISLKPALSVCAKVIFLKRVAKGQLISYGGTYQTHRESKIATVSIGYADGYSRLLSNQARVLVRGQYAKVIGRICMDQLMIDVTDMEEVKVGDEVVLFGRQENNTIAIEEVANLSHTINYEVMCLIGKRVPREYYKNGQYQFAVDYFDILETGLHIDGQ